MGFAPVSIVVATSALLFCGWTNPKYTQRKFKTDGNENRLELRSRDENINQLRLHSSAESPLDVLIVGGGSVGSGAALDASMRGLKVGLVEMQDYGSGTSSRSTKLIHGGIRYLEKAVMKLDVSQMKLVAEALRERGIMIHQAPHLCHPLPTLIPCYDVFELIKYYAGLKLYDLVAAWTLGTLSYSSFVTPYNALRIHPYLRTTSPTNSALLGAVQYYDGQMNDARLCFSVAMSAAALGAAVTNYVEVKRIDVVKNGRKEDVVRSVLKDLIHGKEFEVFSKAIINAGGPFVRQIEERDEAVKRGEVKARTTILPSIGTHIVVDRQYCPRSHTAMVVPSNDGRIVFTIPWLGGCLMGTTDLPCSVTTDPKPTKEEVQFLLDNAKPYIGPIPQDAVRSTWAGIRPLAAPDTPGSASDTQNVVREHLIQVENSRKMVSVSGGKWTTYRKIAEEAVDATVARFFSDELRRGSDAALKPCNTENVVLLGARKLLEVPTEEASGLPSDVYRHWRSNYGDRFSDLLQLLLEREGHSGTSTRGGVEEVRATSKMNCKRLGGPHSPVTEAEVIWSARHEHCEHISDFLSRRTRMAFIDAKLAKQSIPRVADLMAAEKGWTSAKKKMEIQRAHEEMESFLTSVKQ